MTCARVCVISLLHIILYNIHRSFSIWESGDLGMYTTLRLRNVSRVSYFPRGSISKPSGKDTLERRKKKWKVKKRFRDVSVSCAAYTHGIAPTSEKASSMQTQHINLHNNTRTAFPARSSHAHVIIIIFFSRPFRVERHTVSVERNVRLSTKLAEHSRQQ